MTAAGRSVRSSDERLPILLACVAMVIVWAVALSVGPLSDVRVNDLPIYRDYAEKIWDGRLPYLDFALEYPPLAVIPFALGGIAGLGEDAYTFGFGALMLLAGLGVVLLTAVLARERASTAAWIVALSPLVTGAMIRTHFDLVPIFLLLAALYLILKEEPLAGFALLGVGAMVKLFPAVLVPVAAAWWVAKGRPGMGVKGAAVFLAVVVLISLPIAGEGYVDSYRYHLDRPVQIESIPATVLFALDDSNVTGAPGKGDAYRSNGLVGGPADAVATLFAVLLLATLGLITWLVSRRADDRALLLGAFAAVLAFMALGKVLSPQFLIWVVPFAALAWTWGERALALLCFAAVALTHIEFPSRYTQLVGEDSLIILLVAARNALLVSALVLAVWRLSRPAAPLEAEAARSSPRAVAA